MHVEEIYAICIHLFDSGINKCGYRNVLSKRQVWMSIFHIINFKKNIHGHSSTDLSFSRNKFLFFSLNCWTTKISQLSYIIILKKLTHNIGTEITIYKYLHKIARFKILYSHKPMHYNGTEINTNKTSL
jgi:hypothetical protein